MNQRIKKSLFHTKSLGLFFTLFFLIFLKCGKDPKDINPKPAFDFSLPDLNGKIHNLVEFKGQIVVINLWATWCPPCVEEVPKLSNLYLSYKSRGIQVIGIALDKDSLDLLGQFMKKNGIIYLVLVGNEKILASLSIEPIGKNFKGVPTTLVFDQKGQIYKRFDGSFNLQQLEESIQTLLNQK